MRVFIEDTAGQKFECDVPSNTPLSTVAADFFEDRGWNIRDGHGRNQRAVVELVDPTNPSRTKRLRGDLTVEKAALRDGDTLRIFPESIAGTIEPRNRVRALVSDQQEILELVEWNTHVKFKANSDTAPWRYIVTFDYPSFAALSNDGHTPLVRKEHQVEIVLHADYPRHAPFVRWLTPIFHPNIRQSDGAVCLGVLMERYLPGMGLARLVTMLGEMLQYRNYDFIHPLNAEAATWASERANWHYIDEIDGSPFQGPVEDLLNQLMQTTEGGGPRTRLDFRSLNKVTGAP
jgi:ubiquitin-protein ligase